MSKAGKKSSKTTIQKEPRGTRAASTESKMRIRSKGFVLLSAQSASLLAKMEKGGHSSASALGILQLALNKQGKYQWPRLSLGEALEYEV